MTAEGHQVPPRGPAGPAWRLARIVSQCYNFPVIGDTIVSILQRLIDLGQGALSPAAAQTILQIHFGEADQARVRELASRSNSGTLTTEEAAEYDSYLAADDVLSLWQSKARLCLKNHPSAA